MVDPSLASDTKYLSLKLFRRPLKHRGWEGPRSHWLELSQNNVSTLDEYESITVWFVFSQNNGKIENTKMVFTEVEAAWKFKQIWVWHLFEEPHRIKRQTLDDHFAQYIDKEHRRCKGGVPKTAPYLYKIVVPALNHRNPDISPANGELHIWIYLHIPQNGSQPSQTNHLGNTKRTNDIDTRNPKFLSQKFL